MRGKLAENLLKTIRFYTFNSPIRKGKYRLISFALNRIKEYPEHIKAVSTDGRNFRAKLATGMYTTVYFLGEYESYVTEVISKSVKKGDVCFDVGANFGWYSTLLQKLVTNGSSNHTGAVHCFEPIPSIFENLQENYILSDSPPNLFLNNFALSDENSTAKIYTFEGVPNGHSSLSDKAGRTLQEQEIKTVRLDSYLEQKQIEQVDFLKVDIEGAELKCLSGAEKLFRQKNPPVILMEMALKATENFGYLPNDLISFIKKRGDYEFYALDEINLVLHKIDGFAPGDLGANVLALPRSQSKIAENFRIV